MAGRARVCLIGANEEENEPGVRRGVFIGFQRRASSQSGARRSCQREGEDHHGVVLLSSSQRG